MSSISSSSIFEKVKLARLLSPVTRRYGHPQSSRVALEFAVRVLRDHINLNPKDDFARFVLGDFLNDLNRYSESLNVAKKGYDINPKNPRNAYSVATAYNILSSARLLNKLHDPNIALGLEQMGLTRELLQEIDRQLKSLNISAQNAAEQAIIFFEKTLEHRLSRQERRLTLMNIESLRRAFPDLAVHTNTGKIRQK